MVCAVMLAVGGCTSEQISRHLYEGVRMHNENMRAATGSPPSRDSQSYDQYEAERKRLEMRKNAD